MKSNVRMMVYLCVLAVLALAGPLLLDMFHVSPSVLRIVLACSIPLLIIYMVYRLVSIGKAMASAGQGKRLALVLVLNVVLVLALVRFWLMSVGWWGL